MNPSTGQLAFIFIAALLLACAAAWLVAWRYRSAMRRLMLAPVAGVAAGAAAAASSAHAPPPTAVSLADNRRAALRLTLLLTALSCLIAASGAYLWLWLSFPDQPFAPKRAAVLALMQLWPLVPALGLLWRWSLLRLLGALALFCVLCFAVMLWRSIEPRPLELVLGLAVEIGPALAMVALVFIGSATRAVAPWLLPVFVGLVWASMIGLDLLAMLIERRSPVVLWLVSWAAPAVGMALFALLPWALAWWPLQRLGRALAQAYVRKQLSELLVMFTSVWALALLVQAITVASSAGIHGIALLLPLLWIPLVITLGARLRAPSTHPPTLLVLRVFQHDAQVQRLFDHVVERWRLSGNTVLIAGTDLADRTLDADDIFTFLDGRLATRFISRPAELAPRLAAFDLAPDADGRFRVNECYCVDATWQDALHALVDRSDVVLMDLRGFQAHNAGCRYELDTLARSARALRVVVLVDAKTDRAAAAESVLGAAPERFSWIDAGQIDARRRGEVLAALFASGGAPHP
ncbi:MAG: hypothetical protein ABI781_02625 [Burkholderiales bacterium]